jgi:hypothetical protein
VDSSAVHPTWLDLPKLAVKVKRLSKLYKEFENSGDPKKLVTGVTGMMEATGSTNEEFSTSDTEHKKLTRDDLYLICFDFVS